MKAPIASAHALLQTLAVAHVTLNAFEVRTSQAPQIGAWPQQGFDSMASSDEFVDQIRSDKARSTGDETVHPAMMAV